MTNKNLKIQKLTLIFKRCKYFFFFVRCLFIGFPWEFLLVIKKMFLEGAQIFTPPIAKF